MRAIAYLTAAVVLAISASTTGIGATADSNIEVSSANVVVGGSPIEVRGEGFASCADRDLTVALMFPRSDETGNLEPVAEAPRVSQISARVDPSGALRAEVSMPTEFPGEWLGFAVAEGDCLAGASGRRLAEVYVSVALGGPDAQQLGISQEAGAVLVVPASSIRDYPIMVDDPEKDPYAKLAPFVAVGPDGRDCGSAGADDRTPAGDILITLSAECSVTGMTLGLKVLDYGYLLNTSVTVREGYASGVRLVFPPPGSGRNPEAPAPPAAGNAAAPLTGQSWDSALWLMTFSVICAATISLLVAKRRGA